MVHLQLNAGRQRETFFTTRTEFSTIREGFFTPAFEERSLFQGRSDSEAFPDDKTVTQLATLLTPFRPFS